MNHKLLPVVAALLILSILLGTTSLTYALTPTIAPKLEVTTIPQDDQKREKGIMILGLGGDSTFGMPAIDLMSQHKILVTYNGQFITWVVGFPTVRITCNVLEKDKGFVVKDPKTGKGQQFTSEKLYTKLVDVSSNFICKVRWKTLGGPAGTMQESVGVLDVYFTGTAKPIYIADHILLVQATMTIGRTIVMGADIQDICVLGWAMTSNGLKDLNGVTQGNTWVLTKPDGSLHWIFADPLGPYAGCEDAAVVQRLALSVPFPAEIDPLAPK
jgi:hypothetical protein